MIPAGRLAPGNQSGRAKAGGGQSRRGKAVQGEVGEEILVSLRVASAVDHT